MPWLGRNSMLRYVEPSKPRSSHDLGLLESGSIKSLYCPEPPWYNVADTVSDGTACTISFSSILLR